MSIRAFRLAALTAVVVWPIVACSQSADTVSERAVRDGITMVDKDDPAMLRAFERARATLDDFLKTAAAAPAGLEGFAVKVGITEGEEVEYFWISPFSHTGDDFVGTINNDAELVKHVHLGDQHRFKRSAIVDWVYNDPRGPHMYGNYTACALLVHESPEEAAAFRKEYGLECD